MSSWGMDKFHAFAFREKPMLPSGRLTCTRKKDCPSDTIHYEHCEGLKHQLVGIKERRRAFEEGRHARP